MRNLSKRNLRQVNGGTPIRIEDWYDPNCGREEGCYRKLFKKITPVPYFQNLSGSYY